MRLEGFVSSCNKEVQTCSFSQKTVDVFFFFFHQSMFSSLFFNQSILSSFSISRLFSSPFFSRSVDVRHPPLSNQSIVLHPPLSNQSFVLLPFFQSVDCAPPLSIVHLSNFSQSVDCAPLLFFQLSRLCSSLFPISRCCLSLLFLLQPSPFHFKQSMFSSPFSNQSTVLPLPFFQSVDG